MRSTRLVLWALALSACRGTGEHPILVPVRPHIVHVLTDDQRWDTLPGVAPDRMPQDVFAGLEASLMADGVTFENGYNSNPLCAPARASLLSGGYASHHTGVRGNRWPGGGARAFDDSQSLAVLLQRRGYRTAFVGKYLNGYSNLTGTAPDGQTVGRLRYVPPGWDVFLHRQFSVDWYEHFFVLGMSTEAGPTLGLKLPRDRDNFAEKLEPLLAGGFPQELADYLLACDFRDPPHVTVFEQEVALALLDHASDSDDPWFILLALEAPHQPATPTAADRDVYAGFQHASPGVNEVDLSDKPEHVALRAEHYRSRNPIGPYDSAAELWQRMLESLRSVDRLITSLHEKISSEAELRDSTALFVSTDNGYLWGEHGLREKRAPYEESVRSPLIVRVPGFEPGVRSVPVAVDLDVPATILHLAGEPLASLAERGLDGRSLLSVLGSPDSAFRPYRFCENFGVEAGGPPAAMPAWASVTLEGWKYIEYDYTTTTGEPAVELFDLANDPFELESVHARPGNASRRKALAEIVARERGLVVIGFHGPEHELAAAAVGRPYVERLCIVGGTPPYSVEIEDPDASSPTRRGGWEWGLPPGFVLSRSGELRGTAQAAGRFEFTVLVTDSTRSPFDGEPQVYRRRVRLVVSADGS